MNWVYRPIGGLDGWYCDNFHADPGFILERLVATPLSMIDTVDREEKEHIGSNSLNGQYFYDGRHYADDPDYYNTNVVGIIDLLADNGYKVKCKQGPSILTNVHNFLDDPFNDYINNYWWPHTDYEFACITYLNQTSENNGTNIYEINREAEGIEEELKQCGSIVEHESPWRSKKYYNVIDYLEPVFNRAYLFKSKELLHGQAVHDKTFFSHDRLRINQVNFFDAI